MNSIESIFISGGSNTVANGCKWISLDSDSCDQTRVTDGIVVYAMNNIIAISTIYKDSKQAPEVLCTLRGHKGRINSIDFINNSNFLYIFSCSEDTTIKIWRCRYVISSLESFSQWSECQTLRGNFQASIVLLSCLSIDRNYHFIVGSDSSGKCVSWLCQTTESSIQEEGSSYSCCITDEFKVPSIQMCNALNLLKLPSMNTNNITILLVSGCVDSKIHLRAATLDFETKRIPEFSYMGSLSGHEEWITSISSYCDSDNNILLASGSQDCKVRIWRIASTFLHTESIDFVSMDNRETHSHIDEGDDGDNIAGDEGDVELVPEENLSEARLTFHIFGTKYSIFFDALLLGHEDWITSVHWKRAVTETASTTDLQLFTTSMDRNMIIWKPDSRLGGVWQPITRFGDIGGTLGGSIGANLLGFINGNVSNDGTAVLGIGYGGSFHLWKRNLLVDRWFPESYLSGHFGAVNDICWASDGSYLISVSSDQTCRLFAPILKMNNCYWREISRPQIHGYDLHTISVCPKPSLTIFTGGDEKLIRQFDAPLCVIEGIQKLSSLEKSVSINTDKTYRAFIPELGLSNKAYDLITKQEREELDARNVTTLDWSTIPLESQLSDYTIWPEIKKLYGHSNDVVVTAITKCGKYLASSSKARNPVTAGIIIWNTSTMLIHQTLLAHESTVACLRFSHDDKFLISAGKDRTLCVFAYDNNQSMFSIYAAKKNAHKRIIWDVAWINNNTLCSVSRDGTCKIWKFSNKIGNDISELTFIHSFFPFNDVSVTSVDILNDLLAVGSEFGDISIFKISYRADDLSNNESEVYSTFMTSVDSVFAHGSTVKRIRWRPLFNDDMNKYLATCSEDFSVRIFRVNIV